MGKRFVVQIVACLALSAGFVSCADVSQQPATPEMVEMVRAGAGAFNGTWNVILNPTKDTCGMGVNNAVPVTIAIQQQGKKATLAIQGLPPYKGTVTGKKLTARGSYKYQTLNLASTVKASLKGARLQISKSRIKVNNGGQSCYIEFTGSGTKA